MEPRLTPQQLAALEHSPKELMGALVARLNRSEWRRVVPTASVKQPKRSKGPLQWQREDRQLGEHPPLGLLLYRQVERQT